MRNTKKANTLSLQDEVKTQQRSVGDTCTLTYKYLDSQRRNGALFKQSVSELSDNSSIDAGADVVIIEIFKSDDNSVEKVIIADNGCGMDEETLLKSFQPGVDREYKANDTGKYRMGGTIYPLAWFDNKKTITQCEEGSLLKRFSDMRLVEKFNEWCSYADDITSDEQDLWDRYTEELHKVSKRKFKSGTVIELTMPIKTIKYSKAVSSVKQMAGARYRSQISKNNLKILVNNTEIEPTCPLLKDNVLMPEVIYYKKDKNGGLKNGGWRIEVADLSNLDGKDSRLSKHGVRLGQDSGFYFERNGVLINDKPVFWSDYGLPEIEGSSKKQRDNKFRCLVSFNDNLDDEFGVGNDKSRILMSQSIGDQIYEFAFPHTDRLRKNESSTTKQSEVEKTIDKVSQSLSNPYVKPKMSHGSNKGRTVVRVENGRKAHPVESVWVKRLSFEHMSPNSPNFYIDGEPNLVINKASPFLVDKIGTEKATGLDVLSYFAVAIESAYKTRRSEKVYPCDCPDGITTKEYRAIRNKVLDEFLDKFHYVLKNL